MANNEELLDMKEITKRQQDYSKLLLYISIIVAIILFAMAFLDYIGGINTGLLWIDFVALGLMAICGPYGFYATSKHTKIKEIESRLPDCLRDVAEAGRFGMTLAEAVKVASRGRYGTLTPEIRRMAAQIDWGVPAGEAMHRVRRRPLPVHDAADALFEVRRSLESRAAGPRGGAPGTVRPAQGAGVHTEGRDI